MAYATDNTEVPLEEENSAETNADKIVKAIRDDLMHQSIDAGNGAEGMKIAALAAEFDSRLSERVEQPPAHIDPRGHIEEGRTEDAVDEWLGEIADSLAAQARGLDDASRRERLLDVVAELDTRIGGGTR